jgi:hypothetical protein
LLAPLIGNGTIDDTAMVAIVARSWAEAPLFAVHAHDEATDTGAQDLTALAPQSEGLFVQPSGRNPQQ